MRAKMKNESYKIVLWSDSLGKIAVSRETWPTEAMAQALASKIKLTPHHATGAIATKSNAVEEGLPAFTADADHINFAELRAQLKWTQQDFAAYLGTCIRTYQKWEYEDTEMPIYARRSLLKALKYDGYLPINF